MTYSLFLPGVHTHGASTVLELINVMRQSEGLPLLLQHEGLQQSAQEWADHMRDNDVFFHAPDWAERIIRHYPEWRAVGENIGAQGNAAAIVNAWMGSAGHRANILSVLFQEAGVGHATGGRYKEYWVVNFGAKR